MDAGKNEQPNLDLPHLSLAELEAKFRQLPAPPQERGRVVFIVARDRPGIHRALERVRLTRDEGLPEDDWRRRRPSKIEAQLAIMRYDVAKLIAQGQPLTAFGDNLFVDLDLSTASLPTGSRLRVGEALVEVTPMPHDGCRKFQARFGVDAFRFVQATATRPQNLRGIYWKVIEEGEVYLGAPIGKLASIR